MKEAPVPVPSQAIAVVHAVAPPAREVTLHTVATNSNFRMRLFPLSATYTLFPRPSTATPVGEEKDALVPGPAGASRSAGCPFPAMVITAPATVTARMRLLPVSAT